LAIFSKEGILLKINGEQPIEEITKEILSRLQK
jgi:adenylate kinase family enzyme